MAMPGTKPPVRVAVAAGATEQPAMLTVGAELYPLPPLLMAMLRRPPLVWPVVAVAVAATDGLPQLKLTTGELQPEPALVTVTPVTTPLTTVATAVGATAQPEIDTDGVEV